MDKHDLNYQPVFTTDSDGRPNEVSLDVKSYVSLLVRADVTEPTLWPPGLEGGAATLARVRQIESECISLKGEFDWEELSRDAQDEYDNLCALLDSLQETDIRIDWEEYKTRIKGGLG